jgi:glycosyltransferase involved in cell wall biosynthesis
VGVESGKVGKHGVQRMPKRPATKRSKKTRLLFVRRTTAFGGSEIVILDLLKEIDYQNNEVFLASPVNVFSSVLAELKLPVTFVPVTVPFTGGFLKVFFSWVSYLRRQGSNKIILAEGGFADFPLPIVLAAFAVVWGNIWMMELHPAPEPSKRKPGFHFGLGLGLRERTRAWLTKGILSVSHGVKDRLVRGYGYAPEKISVVYNGVDTKRFSPAPQELRKALRRNLQIPEDAMVVVSAARLDDIKRLDRLIKAFDVLSFERKDLWLLLTGEGPLRGELMALAQSLQSRERIGFLGHVEDVCATLRASDIYVLPSDEEGFGIALVEAMACELVCVATKTVGPSEIIEDSRNGFLTERTYEGVLGGLQQALQLGTEARKLMGRCARQRVIENFRVEESVAKGLAFMEISPVTRTAL